MGRWAPSRSIFAVFDQATAERKIRYRISDLKQAAIDTWGQPGDIPATKELA